MFPNVLITTARAQYDQGTTGTFPPQPNILSPTPAHLEAVPLTNRLQLRQAGVMARLWCSVDFSVDILPGDEITNVVDIFDGTTQWPAPIFGPLGQGQKTWTVTNVIASPSGLLQQRIVYIDSDTTGGPELLG